METQNSEIIERARALRDDMTAKFANSDIVENVEWEAAPFLFMITDAMLYTAGADRERRQRNYEDFMAAFFDGSAPEEAAFASRRKLYGSVMHGTLPRSELCGGDCAMYWNNTLAKLTAAFLDILVDPACADDYEGAPLVLFDEADAAIALSVAFEAVFPELTAYAAWLRETGGGEKRGAGPGV